MSVVVIKPLRSLRGSMTRVDGDRRSERVEVRLRSLRGSMTRGGRRPVPARSRKVAIPPGIDDEFGRGTGSSSPPRCDPSGDR